MARFGLVLLAVLVGLLAVVSASGFEAEIKAENIPTVLTDEKNPFIRNIDPNQREKLELASDIHALHEQILKMGLQIQGPAPKVTYKKYVKADNVRFLPMEPPTGWSAKRAAEYRLDEKAVKED